MLLSSSPTIGRTEHAPPARAARRRQPARWGGQRVDGDHGRGCKLVLTQLLEMLSIVGAISTLLAASTAACRGMDCQNLPPPNNGPVATPTQAQLAWHDREVGAMITFNMQTYGLLPVGHHRAAPPASTFSPDQLDTDAWVKAAQSFGAKYAVLTASHRSGFALWPTKSHNYSVAFSGQAGRDILREFVASCRKFGVSPGVFWTQRFNYFFGVPNGTVDPARAVQPVSQAEYLLRI